MHYDLRTYTWHFAGSRLPATSHELVCGLGDSRFHRRQIILSFENGWGLSVVWGSATYSDNHNAWGHIEFVEEPLAVEVGVLEPKGQLWGEPFGYVASWELRLVVDVIMAMPSSDWPERPDEVWSAQELNAWHLKTIARRER